MDVVIGIVEFKKQLKVRGYAPATIESYSYNISHFKRYLQSLGIEDLRYVTVRIVNDFHHKIMSESTATSTRALKIRAVKRLFEYLVDTNQLLINPAERIKETQKANKRIQPVLSENEVRKLLDQPNLSLRLDIRDRAVMEVLYSTGIRSNELVSLNIYDVDLSDKILYIRKGKGRKQRVVPLGKSAVIYLREYLQKIRPRYAAKNPRERALFLTRTGATVINFTVRALIKKYVRLAKIKTQVTAHTLRRTCATHMLKQGADIRYIQKLLGHSSIRTTQIYTQVIPVDVKLTHSKTHPNMNHED